MPPQNLSAALHADCLGHWGTAGGTDHSGHLDRPWRVATQGNMPTPAFLSVAFGSRLKMDPEGLLCLLSTPS